MALNYTDNTQRGHTTQFGVIIKSPSVGADNAAAYGEPGRNKRDPHGVNSIMQAVNFLMTGPDLNLPYAQGGWNEDVPARGYWTGDFYKTFSHTVTEDSHSSYLVYLRGHFIESDDSGDWETFESDCERVDRFFAKGLRGVIGPGLSWAVRPRTRRYIDTGTDGFHVCEIVLKIEEWRA